SSSSTSRCSRATHDSVSRARCQSSSWSPSATEAPKRRWSWAFTDRSSLRLPFSERFSGKCSSTERMPTQPAPKALRGGGRSRRRRVEIGALDLTRLVDLQHVAFLEVVEALEQDAALEALLDLADVVLEALQLRDPGLVDHGAVADDADVGAAANLAVRDVRAGNRAEPRDAEELPDLDLADRLLRANRLEHPDQGLL